MEPVETLDKEGNLILDKETGRPLKFLLGTEQYQCQHQRDGDRVRRAPDSQDPMSIFNEHPKDYRLGKEDLTKGFMEERYTPDELEEARRQRADQTQETADAMVAALKSEAVRAQGFLTCYKGQELLYQDSVEISTGLPFQKTDDESMRLKMTPNRKHVTLTSVRRASGERQFKNMSWQFGGGRIGEHDRDFTKLDEAMTSFCRSNSKISDILDIQFFNDCNYILLKYTEVSADDESVSAHFTEELKNFEKDKRVRKLKEKAKRVKKFALFDSGTGNLIIDYDGKLNISSNMVYCFDVLPYQIEGDGFEESLAFFFVSDDQERDQNSSSEGRRGSLIKMATRLDDQGNGRDETSKLINWCYMPIPVQALAEIKSYEAQVNAIGDCLNDGMLNGESVLDDIDIPVIQEGKNTFKVPEQVISQNSRLNGFELQVSTNEDYSEFVLLHTPYLRVLKPLKYIQRMWLYSINHETYLRKRERLEGEVTTQGINPSDYCLEKEFQTDHEIFFGRNPLSKRHIFVISSNPDYSKLIVMYMRLNQCGRLDKNYRVESRTENKGLDDYYFDLREENNINQKLLLRFNPVDNVVIRSNKAQNLEVDENSYSTNYRKLWTQQFLQRNATYPLAYQNIGKKQIAIYNLVHSHKYSMKHTDIYMYKLDWGHTFESFVDFISYEQIGFIADPGLRIETCTPILFISSTWDMSKKTTLYYLNLILFDLYQHEGPQMAVFQSSFDFHGKKVDTKGQYIHKCMIQSRTQHNGYEPDQLVVYVIMQLYDRIIRARVKNKALEVQKKGATKQNLISYMDSHDSRMQKITMVQDPANQHIFYTGFREGQVHIVEIDHQNPDSGHDKSIFCIKSRFCQGLSLIEDQFLFMDEFLRVSTLKRVPFSRSLQKISERQMRASDVSLMNVQNEQSQSFDEDIILGDGYAIDFESIFYIQDHTLFQLEDQRVFNMIGINHQPEFQGRLYVEETVKPILIKGSQKFLQTMRFGKMQSYMFVSDLPDATQQTLLLDFQNQAQFSTYLNDEKILIGINDRFFLFETNGRFIDEIQFEVPQDFSQKIGSFMNDAEPIKTKLEVIQTNLMKKQRQNELQKLREGTYIQQLYAMLYDQQTVYEKFNSKLALEKLSPDRTKFLFFDTQQETIQIFDLQIVENQRPKLVFMYTLPTHKSKIFQEFQQENQKFKGRLPEKSFLTFVWKELAMTLQNNGNVSICRQKTVEQGKYLIQIESFQQDKPEPEFVTQDYQLNFDADEINEKQITEQKTILNKMKKKIENDLQRQKFKPLRDRTELMLIEDEIVRLQMKVAFGHVTAKVWGSGQNQTTVIWTANKVLYRYHAIEGEFKSIDVNFEDTVEVQRVMKTEVDYVYQIIAVDTSNQITTILSWDIKNNLEKSCKQLHSGLNQCLIVPQSNFVVKGMNIKLNYFADANYLVDLHKGIPLLRNKSRPRSKIHNNAMILASRYQIDNINFVNNQVKVHKNNQVFLGILRPCQVTRPYSIIDLKFWAVMAKLNYPKPLISEFLELEDFSLVVEGQSLFHIFASNDNVISVVATKYQTQSNAGTISDIANRMPLQILLLNKNKITATEMAIKEQKLANFDFMIKMLSYQNDYTVSKHFLDEIDNMIMNPTPMILSFFNNALFRPLYMQIPFKLKWVGEKEYYLFTSNTSVIGEAIIREKFPDQIDLSEEQDTQIEDASSEDPEHILDHRLKYTEGQEEIRETKLNIEAFDFDWIFESNNATNFIKLLNETEDIQIFSTRLIRMFVELVWEHYQSAIIKKVFIPTVLYVLVFVYLTCEALVRWVDETVEDTLYMKIEISILTIICFAGAIGQTIYEIKQFKEDTRDYLTSVWNYLDMLSVCINWATTIISALCIYTSSWYISRNTVMIIGGLACFILWVKMFYWMALFKQVSYYVMLIRRTIDDIKPFLTMVIMIQTAFACFFFMININVQEDSTAYITLYTQKDFVLNSLLNSYLIFLGDFNYGNYGEGDGHEKYFVWGMFILATFLGIVVFMNMLIAIMGDTFGTLQATYIENGLKEQVGLMHDNLWLVDINKVFEGQKYIIMLSPTISAQGNETDDIKQLFTESRLEQEQEFQKINKAMQFLGEKISQQQLKMDRQIEQTEEALKGINSKLEQLTANHGVMA